MGLLLTYSQQIAIKKISANNRSKYDLIAAEVEKKELGRLLGVALLQDIQQNPTTPENIKLLDGGTYTNYLGQTITFEGIRYVLAYFNYAKYLGQSFVNDTFTGMVTKTRPDSERITAGELRTLINDNREIAMGEWELIKEFLDLNSSDYPLWLCSLSTKPNRPRFYTVRKTLMGSKKRIYDQDYRCPVPRNN